jgi:HEAT repeat protein
VIGRVGRQEDSHVIELLLKDPSPLTRRAAVEAFARLDCGTAAESLRLALGDEASTVRIAAASALGASKSDDVIEDLCCLAADDDTNVRAAAVRAAGSRVESASPGADIGPAMNLIDAALEDEAVVALAAVDALCHLGGRGIERMLRVVDRPEPELVQAAVRCIGESGELGALEALLALISHPDWTVRAETIQVLADRGLDRAVPPILRALDRLGG